MSGRLDAILIEARLIAAGTSLRDLRSDLPTVRIVALSGSANADEAIRCIRAGVDGVLSPNATTDEVAESLDRINQGELALPTHRATVLLKRLAQPDRIQQQAGPQLTRWENEIMLLAACQRSRITCTVFS